MGKGKYIILIGNYGSGKTEIALNIAIRAAARGDGLRLVPFDLSLEPWAGKTVAVELLNEPTGWLNEAALWRDIRITANTGL